MAKIRVFIDSSVIITALLSTQGGGFYILNSLKDNFEFQTNEYGVREIIKTFQNKFNHRPELIGMLYLLLGNAQIITLSNPTNRERIKAARYISLKDAPILASALNHSDYLITLDNEFLNPEILELAKSRGLVILKPKGFIELFRI